MPGSGEHCIDRPLTIHNERSQIQLEASNLAEIREVLCANLCGYPAGWNLAVQARQAKHLCGTRCHKGIVLEVVSHVT